MKKILSLVLALTMLLSMVVTAANADALNAQDELHTYQTQANEVEKWNILYSEGARDLNVLVNLTASLLSYDEHGVLQPNAAKEWSSPDAGKTWTFVLNEGIKWVDKDGNEKGEVVAQDWLTALEWVLNAKKNGAFNTSMTIAMIEGAGAYYDYTSSLDEAEALALTAEEGSKFAEMVSIKAEGKYTLTYTCTAETPYFPTVATSACLYPISAGLIDEIGVEGVKALTWETMWYSGPYLISSHIDQNEKILVANPAWFDAENHTRFETVSIRMVESPAVAYELFATGQLDHVTPEQSTVMSIYNNASHEFNANLVEAMPTKYSWQIHFVYDKKNEDGTPDVNWNTAVANEAFRLAWYYGLDFTTYFGRLNPINPLSCQNYAYTANKVGVMSDGRDYTEVVLEKLGMAYDYTTYNRVDPEKAAAYKAQAMEELTAKGVTFPVVVDYYISGASQTAKDTADVLAQTISDCLGDDFVTLNIKTYISSITNEVRVPRLAAIYVNGWGADFGDPENFLGQETYGEDSAYYSNNYVNVNDATDPDLIATYQEFTRLVNEARKISGDMDARYEAYADAEVYFIQHALTIPLYYEISWELSAINDYSKSSAAFGIFANYYVDWEYKVEGDILMPYTNAEWAELAK